ncbi:RNA_GG_bind domain-containing protein [Cephalotus follicularis]|uniref:Phosphorylated adapter RNA export protein n=1 Tax=Cephalotus follicularis TaxID=3775 RepID=A0A1Q3APQ3_CEPFO|nr:RNA_GG_bind domain-containing protein [Cephalotus follicularis]
MEEGESIFEDIYGDDGVDNLEDVVNDDEDVEMADVEEGELMEQHNTQQQSDLGQNSNGVDDANGGNQGTQNRNRRRRANKKKNKKRRGAGGSVPYVTDIDRFVLDTCRRLKERKSYMVYTAVGCLGVSALSNFVKEVEAIQACGGQTTADGKRNRTGGGILWSIIKAQAPMSYKEIMKKAKEFERQFRQQNVRQAPDQNKQSSLQRTTSASAEVNLASVSEGPVLAPQNQHEPPDAEGKRKSVHDRIRVPVSYADLLGDDPKIDSA